MNILKKISKLGLRGTINKANILIKEKSGYWRWRYRNAPVYANPTSAELAAIERDLNTIGVEICDYAPPPEQFKAFQAENWFPSDYHGGLESGVWDEKLLEHWLSAERLGVMGYSSCDTYVDVAAASSPWVRTLRDRKGIDAYAIDLCEIGESYRHLPYYRVENATQTTFADASVTGMSLHCAYEMFMNDDDTRFINEAARILKPGGKVVILPLYMHTQYCAYATPEYYGKGYSDPAAKEFIRIGHTGIPSSRKYDAATLKKRVLDPIQTVGLRYRLLALHNKADLGNNIYCHFILEIEK